MASRPRRPFAAPEAGALATSTSASSDPAVLPCSTPRTETPYYDDTRAFLALGTVQDARVSLLTSDGPRTSRRPRGARRTLDARRSAHRVAAHRRRTDHGLRRSEVQPPSLGYLGGRCDSGSGSDTARVGERIRRRPLPRPLRRHADLAIYRVIADKDGTVFTYEPSKPDGAPEKLDAGQLGVFITGESFVVRSQDAGHRFHATVAMTSYELIQPHEEWERGIQGRGDPELLNLVPRSEFANRFAFMTDHTYPDAHLVLVRAKEDGRILDMTLGCAGTVTGWKPLGNGDTFENDSVTLSKGKFEPQVYPGGTCHNGPHTMQSDGPFTGYVWGWGQRGRDRSRAASRRRRRQLWLRALRCTEGEGRRLGPVNGSSAGDAPPRSRASIRIRAEALHAATRAGQWTSAGVRRSGQSAAIRPALASTVEPQRRQRSVL